MNASVDVLQGALGDAYQTHRVNLSLTPQGVTTLERVGIRWLQAAIDALLIDGESRRIEVILGVSGVEPMPRGGWVQPGTAGGMYLDGEAVGRVSLVPLDGTADVLKRVVMLPSLVLMDGTGSVAFGGSHGRVGKLVGKAYGVLYDRAPVALDTWKQFRNSRSANSARDAKARMAPFATSSTAPGGENTAWFALHWLEPGGAEVWALEAAEIAKAAGYRVVITVDQVAPQRWLERATEITDHVYLASNVLSEDDWGRFLRGVVEKFSPTFVMIHHSARAYEFLPELRHLRPDVTVLDSTHVVEHRTGGFVRPSIEYTSLIDAHHVISPELRDLYLLDAGINADKVHYHPLISSELEGQSVEPSAAAEEPLRVGFLGRIATQKRPFLFVELARRLNAKDTTGFEFILQGSGPLDGFLGRQISRSGLDGVIQRRAWGPSEDFLNTVDVLVICSDNEGLTLTSLEADRHGVLVMSADVGSQATVVPETALLPRSPRAFLAGAERELRRLANDRQLLTEALKEQHDLVSALGVHDSASTFLQDFVARTLGVTP